MTEAVANIPWLPSGKTVARVARHLRCTPEAAERQIASEGKSGRVKARGVIEDRPVSPLPAAWNGTISLGGATMKPPEASYEIAKLELCFIDLIATGLLPAPAEKARWSAAEAIAYLVKGVPLPWDAWQWAGASPPEIEHAEIDLGEAILAGVPAWGGHPLERRRRRIPSDHFRDEMIENKALPVSAARQPKVVVDCTGCVTTAARQRSADYQGPRWEAVEVDAAALRQVRPRPLTTQAEPTASSAPKKRSRKRTPHTGAQRQRATAVLKRIFPEGRYPDENEMAWADVWIKFSEEYARYAKEHPSNLKCPSPSTVRRVMGRAE